MTKILTEGVPRRNENITWREFGAEAILLDPDSGDYFQLDDVGVAIWKRVDGRKTTGEIVEELSSQFSADDDQLVKDTVAFLGELAGKGLISIES